MYKNGIGFDEEKASTLLKELNSKLEVLHAKMSVYGFVKGIKGNQAAYNYVVEF